MIARVFLLVVLLAGILLFLFACDERRRLR